MSIKTTSWSQLFHEDPTLGGNLLGFSVLLHTWFEFDIVDYYLDGIRLVILDERDVTEDPHIGTGCYSINDGYLFIGWVTCYDPLKHLVIIISDFRHLSLTGPSSGRNDSTKSVQKSERSRVKK